MIKSTEFLNSFASDEKFFLSLPVLWSVTMDGVSEGAVNSVLSDAGEKWRATNSPASMTKNGNILVAQEVTLPNETSSFNAHSSGQMGGFLPGYGLEARSDFLNRGITVNFIETQNDLEHNFFRPWAIAVGIKGLVEHGASLKGNMTVRQYNNKGQFKKGFKFSKVFPTAVEGFTLNYENTEFSIKTVTFACSNYEKL